MRVLKFLVLLALFIPSFSHADYRYEDFDIYSTGVLQTVGASFWTKISGTPDFEVVNSKSYSSPNSMSRTTTTGGTSYYRHIANATSTTAWHIHGRVYLNSSLFPCTVGAGNSNYAEFRNGIGGTQAVYFTESCQFYTNWHTGGSFENVYQTSPFVANAWNEFDVIATNSGVRFVVNTIASSTSYVNVAGASWMEFGISNGGAGDIWFDDVYLQTDDSVTELPIGFPYGYNASGVSTTTPFSDVTLECDPDDPFWERSICNVGVLLFVPSQASVQALDSGMTGLLAKQPFSAYTEFKTAWDDATQSTTTPDSSLTLTFYGEESDIISTTSFASVIGGDSAWDIMRYIIAIGLWIAFGYYAFTRISKFF